MLAFKYYAKTLRSRFNNALYHSRMRPPKEFILSSVQIFLDDIQRWKIEN